MDADFSSSVYRKSNWQNPLSYISIIPPSVLSFSQKRIHKCVVLTDTYYEPPRITRLEYMRHRHCKKGQGMRIEAVAQQSAAVQAGQKPVRLQQGDVVSATVVSRDGDGAVLKCEGGQVLRARLTADLQANDIVELMVSEASQDRLELRVVFVQPAVPHGAAAAAPPTLQGIQGLAEAFAQMGCKADAAKIALATAMLENFSVDEKTAAFFAANDIQPTTQNVTAFAKLKEGSRLGESLYGLAQLFTAEEETAGRAATAYEPWAATQGQEATPVQTPRAMLAQQTISAQVRQPVQTSKPACTQGTAAPNPAGVPQSEPGLTADAPQGNRAVNALPPSLGVLQASPNEENAQETGGAHAMRTNAQENQPESAPATMPQDKPALRIQSGVGTPLTDEAALYAPAGIQEQDATSQAIATRTDGEKGDNDTFIEKQELSLGETSLSKEAQSAASTPKKLETLVRKLLSAFAEGEGLDAQSLKKAARETPQRLAVLQKMVENTDSGVRRPASEKLGELAAQAKLSEDVSRFICLQVPVHQKGYGTAELYVYKRNRKGSQLDPDNACIALGVSTENLGRVEALIRVENRNVFVGMHVENEAAVPDIGAKTAELYKSLGRMRYTLCECKVSPHAEPVTLANAEETLSALANRTPAGIDLRI